MRDRAETRAEVKRLTLLADGERKRSLRVLQAKWHPDSWVGADGEAQAFAAEMAALVNAQAGVAREVAAKGRAMKGRTEAYAALQAALPRVVFGRLVGGADAAKVRAAIADARDAGVSPEEIVAAEELLAKMEANAE